MKIIFYYQKRFHLIIITIGMTIGFIFGRFFLSMLQSDVPEFQNNAELLKIFTKLTIFGMPLLVGGVFNGFYFYISFFRYHNWITRIILILFFYPIGCAISMFCGLLTIIPFFIYDLFYIISKNSR